MSAARPPAGARAAGREPGDAAGEAGARPRVLVLLAARDGASWIEKQIGSVLAQQGVDVRVDVRDDDSRDETRALVLRMAADDPRVRLRPDHAGSGSAAGNFFLLVETAQVADVDLVAFCDQDDEWLPDKLLRAASLLAQVGADGCSSAVLARWPDGRERVLGQCARARAADYLFEGAGQGCTFVMTARLFEGVRKAVRIARPLGLRYHDWMSYAVARAEGLRWCFDARPGLIYRQHAANDTGARVSLAGIARRLEAISQGWYRDEVGRMAELVLAVAPADAGALRWRALAARRGPGARIARAAFLARCGRRRLSDRVVQVLAALFGYL